MMLGAAIGFQFAGVNRRRRIASGCDGHLLVRKVAAADAIGRLKRLGRHDRCVRVISAVVHQIVRERYRRRQARTARTTPNRRAARRLLAEWVIGSAPDDVSRHAASVALPRGHERPHAAANCSAMSLPLEHPPQVLTAPVSDLCASV